VLHLIISRNMGVIHIPSILSTCFCLVFFFATVTAQDNIFYRGYQKGCFGTMEPMYYGDCIGHLGGQNEDLWFRIAYGGCSSNSITIRTWDSLDKQRCTNKGGNSYSCPYGSCCIIQFNPRLFVSFSVGYDGYFIPISSSENIESQSPYTKEQIEEKEKGDIAWYYPHQTTCSGINYIAGDPYTCVDIPGVGNVFDYNQNGCSKDSTRLDFYYNPDECKKIQNRLAKVDCPKGSCCKFDNDAGERNMWGVVYT